MAVAPAVDMLTEFRGVREVMFVLGVCTVEVGEEAADVPFEDMCT